MQHRRHSTTRCRWRWSLARVEGESMRPTLEPGDVLVVCRRAVRCGDLVVIEPRQGRPAMVKRVVDIGADGLWVERDNPQVGVDSWVFGAVPPSAVAGVVRWVVRPPRWGRRR